MRRNGANLLVLAGAQVPREQADPVPVSAVVNAAASEVEDYTRVVTATVPDSEIAGSVAGDLVHLLAELLDNALRYSPPISQVRVSAVHTGNGGLRHRGQRHRARHDRHPTCGSPTRACSPAVRSTPYTARHMGLFVVGRLAPQHGLVVRLRSTIAGEPNSGTTAGVYVPSELLCAPDAPTSSTPAAGHARRCASGIATALALDEAPTCDEYADDADVDQLNGHSEVPVTLLPQRNPGASGIPTSPCDGPRPTRADAARARAAGRPEQPCRTSRTPHRRHRPRSSRPAAQRVRATVRTSPASTSATCRSPRADVAAHRGGGLIDGGSDDAIYQKMLSEWLVDPTDLANSSDLNWESVWDHGWSAAEAAEDAPVHRTPSRACRCASPAPGWCRARLDPPDRGATGPPQRRSAPEHDGDDEVASAAEFGSRRSRRLPARDPDAVRASISSHFGGVHAAPVARPGDQRNR